MSEYISREELIDRLRKTELSADQIRMLVYPKEAVVGAIYDCTSADVRPNIHGYWKRRTYIGNHETVTMFVCSECDKEFGWDIETGIAISDNNFCPNCGAYMREPKEEKGD